MVRPIGLLALCILLAACSLVQPTADAAPPETLRYQRSGGITGEEVVLEVSADGDLRLTHNRRLQQGRLAEPERVALNRLLETIDFAALGRTAAAPVQGADLMNYRLVYRGYVIRATDVSLSTELVPLIELLEGIVQRIAREA